MTRSFSRVVTTTLCILMVAVGFMLIVTRGVLAQEDQDNTVQQVLEAWKKRQDAHRFVLYEWDETSNETHDNQSVELKAKYELRLVDNALAIHSVGDKWRSVGDFDPALPRSNERIFLKSTRTTAFDGQQSLLRVYQYDRRPTPEDPPRIGFRSKEYDEKGNYHVAGVMLHVRPLASMFHNFDAQNLKVVREDATGKGSDIRLQASKGTPETRNKYDLWVDPSADFIVCRTAWTINNKVISQLELHYSEEQGKSPTLAGWSSETFYGDDGTPSDRCRSKVTRYEVETPAAREPVSLEVPTETKVRGEGDEDYLRLPNGKWRTIGRDERQFSPTYEELRDSEPGKAIPQHFLDLHAKMQPIGRVAPNRRQELLAEFKKYIKDQPQRRRHRELAVDIARRLFKSKEPDSAVEMCRDFAKLSKYFANVLDPMAKQFESKLPQKPPPRPDF